MTMNVLFKKIFSIEGNIGAGKTTLLQLLEKQIPNCKVIYEPVSEWKNVGGTDLLKSFYTEPKRWCFTFELESMVSKVRKIKEALAKKAEEERVAAEKAAEEARIAEEKATANTRLLEEIRDLLKKANS